MMKAAAAVNENNLSAVIPESLESAAGIIIVETDSMQAARFAESGWAEAMGEEDVEFLLCGRMYNPELFENLAGLGISRYYAAGMTVRDALAAAMKYKLPAITDYEGGSGCGSGRSECGGHGLL